MEPISLWVCDRYAVEIAGIAAIQWQASSEGNLKLPFLDRYLEELRQWAAGLSAEFIAGETAETGDSVLFAQFGSAHFLYVRRGVLFTIIFLAHFPRQKYLLATGTDAVVN